MQPLFQDSPGGVITAKPVGTVFKLTGAWGVIPFVLHLYAVRVLTTSCTGISQEV